MAPAYLVPLINSCPNLRIIRAVHAAAAKRGVASDRSLLASLASAYARRGSFPDAHHLLDEMPQPNPVPWNAAISGFFRSGDCDNACELFKLMPRPNAVTWSAVVAGLAQNGREKCSLQAFHEMITQAHSTLCTSNTITSVLSACGKLRVLALGRQVHARTVKIGMSADDDAFIGTALVDMYGKCSCMGLATKAFRFLRAKSVVAWSSLIANYVHDNDCLFALQVFREMMLTNSEVPNAVTLTTLITACARIPSLLHGKELHCAVLRRRPSEPDVYVSTALVSMYCKCGSLAYAYRVMESDGRVLGSNLTPMWNAVIAEHVANDRADDALSMIRSMGGALSNGVALSSVTMATILPVCGKSASLLHGKELHCYALKFDLYRETVVGNGLLEMYCKGGRTDLARQLFDRMPERSVVSWTTMIDGYGKQGNGHGAIGVFERMVEERNAEPDHITFVALVSACSHSGLLEEGLKFFEMMTREYGIVPVKENYGCLVDLLARSGNIDEAMNAIKTMPFKPGANVWGALLGACRIHGSVDEAEFAMRHLLEPHPKGSGFRTLLAKVYGEMGRLDSAIKVQKKKVEMGVASRQGCSWLAAEGEFDYG